MQTKTIEKNISSKMEDWLSSITDETLRKKVKENLLVSGGSIANMFLNADVNDMELKKLFLFIGWSHCLLFPILINFRL